MTNMKYDIIANIVITTIIIIIITIIIIIIIIISIVMIIMQRVDDKDMNSELWIEMQYHVFQVVPEILLPKNSEKAKKTWKSLCKKKKSSWNPKDHELFGKLDLWLRYMEGWYFNLEHRISHIFFSKIISMVLDKRVSCGCSFRQPSGGNVSLNFFIISKHIKGRRELSVCT